ncbi:MAG: endonuclease [Paludibacteraceae bacterium]|nr:endonuclease [Paludibacteraceae bacterium]
MRKFAYLLLFVCSIGLHAEEYTITFNSSTSDSSSPATKLESIVYTSTDNCINRLIYADKVYRAKEDFGIKFSSGTAGGKLSIGLNAQYDIQSMTIYAATYGGNNKDSVNAFRVYDNNISWAKGTATVITPYTVKAPGLTDSIVIAATTAKNNRFYVQKIVFTAPDPLPNIAKITTQPVVDFGSAIIEDGQPETDANNVNIIARSTSTDSLVLKLRNGSTFSLSPTKLPHNGGDINVAYTVATATDKGYTITDSLIIIAKGLDGNNVRKAVPVTLFAKSYTPPVLPVDSSCMRVGPMPCDYYLPAQGTKDENLMLSLSEIIHCGPRYRYGSGRQRSWHGFFFTDRDTLTQQVLDMYSNNRRYFNIEDTCASVSGFDIEHMLPKSWWGGDVNEAYCDLYHLVPGDFSANRSKSNNAPGIPADSTFNNGSFVTGSGKNYGLTRVFCPEDKYKGDFARAYFYIVTCYKDLTWVTTGDACKAMTNDSYLEFQPWLQELLLSWHRLDPVSDKEKARAIEVNKIQGNRNPFIDYPDLVEYIWGDKQGQTVNFNQLTYSYGEPCSDVLTSAPDIMITPDSNLQKILLDSHIYIFQDGKYYTLIGQ